MPRYLNSLIALLLIFLSSPHAVSAQVSQENNESEGVKKARPNIVLIISDDQKWSDYGFMGHEKIQTPNLDRLAKSSVLFRRGYVPQALCRSSLMSLVTGRFPFEHRVVGNDPFLGIGKRGGGEYARMNQQMIANLQRFQPLAKVLGEKGYVSHQSGKWWEGSFQNGGFTQGMTQGMGNHKNGRHGDDGLKIGRAGLKPVFDFIDSATESESPFFVWYAPFLPHTPHNPPERLLKKYNDGSVPLKVAKYHAMCEWFDETCGELVGFLDTKELRENTLVIYVCDNGWITAVPGENAPQDWKPQYAPRSKRSPHEAGVRTPIFFSWPKTLPAADRPELVTSLDIYPTILSAAGCEVPQDLSGVNLLPTLSGQHPLDRQTIFGESYSHDVQVVDDPDKSLQHRWCIDENWKLILSYDTPIAGGYVPYRTVHSRPPLLYDLSVDPDENNNLAGQFSEKVKLLESKIEAWRKVDNGVIRQ